MIMYPTTGDPNDVLRDLEERRIRADERSRVLREVELRIGSTAWPDGTDVLRVIAAMRKGDQP